MKITLINGSPKTGHSTSGVLLGTFRALLPADAVIEEFKLNLAGPDEAELEAVIDMDVLVFAFPLYVDGIPAHLLRCLTRLEERLKERTGKKIRVFAIINCGFYEGKQAAIALRMMKHWCDRAGIQWCQGAGIGGGGYLTSIKGITEGQGATKNLWQALKAIAGNLAADAPADDIYTAPNFPRILYTLGGNLGWRRAIKANGLAAGELDRKM